MSFDRFTRCGAVMAAGLVAMCVPAAQAGPVDVFQQRAAISAIAQAPGADEAVDERASEEVGPFDEAVSAEVSGTGISTRATSSLTSSFADNAFRFAGAAVVETLLTEEGADPNEGYGQASYSAITLFTLDEPYRYRLTTNRDVREQDSGNTYTGGTELTTYSIPGQRPAGDIGEDILAPGTYRIFFGLNAYNVPGRTESSSFASEEFLTLELSPLDGDGGGGGQPNPIPLPPAAWSGLVVMGLALLNRCRKSLCA